VLVVARAWLTLRIDARVRAPRYFPSSSLPGCSMQSALAYPVSGSAWESLTQVGRSRAVVAPRPGGLAPSYRLASSCHLAPSCQDSLSLVNFR
jgi:hypothetical protein